MSHILALAKKELRIYFNTPLAYIFITVFLVVSSWLFMQGYFLNGVPTMRSYFQLLPWILLFLTPAVTMRLWAEEKRLGTMEVLLTLPVKDSEAVLGKFLASFIFMGLALLLSFPLAIIVLNTGGNDMGTIIASYLGALLMMGAFLSIGLWVSSLTSNQIIAFIGGIVMCFLFLVIGQEFVIASVPKIFTGLFKYLSLSVHFESIARGVIDSRDIIFYLSVISVFLILNMYSIARKK